MTYNNNIPKPTDLISTSQGQILGNFQAIDSATTGPTTTTTAGYGSGSGFSVDHFSMNTGTAGWVGMHFMVDFPVVQTTDPTALAGNNNYSAIYTKTGTTYAEPYFLNVSSASGKVMWYGGTGVGGVTYLQNTSGTVKSTQLSGYINYPNGMQERWGRFIFSSASGSVTFVSAFTNSCRSLQITPYMGSATVSEASVAIVAANTEPTSTGFSYFATTGSGAFYYHAIGN
jgi:hypothetical protein